MSFANEVWSKLAAVDVNAQAKKKGNLTFLSWAWAWGILMNRYPESNYEFKAPVVNPDGSVEIWCDVTISEGESSLTRSMWLPVMDFKNNSVVNPSTREISDTRMRCLTKCLGMFGLGHYIYAGEDIPDPEVQEAAKKADYTALVDAHQDSITAVKDSIADESFSAGAEAWFELSEDVQRGLWVAPSKGGVFTTAELKTMKSAEFKASYFGES